VECCEYRTEYYDSFYDVRAMISNGNIVFAELMKGCSFHQMMAGVGQNQIQINQSENYCFAVYEKTLYAGTY